jgi:hypothetical protein
MGDKRSKGGSLARNFKSDLNKGVLGEQLFKRLFTAATSIDGLKGDLTVNGLKVELKSDYYDMHSTLNYFMEHYGNMDKQKLGGPFKALADGCPYFVYFYVNQLSGSIWRTQELVAQLETILPKLKSVHVPNKSWTTLGYKVPRSLLRPGIEFAADRLHVLSPDYTFISTDWGYKPQGRR